MCTYVEYNCQDEQREEGMSAAAQPHQLSNSHIISVCISMVRTYGTAYSRMTLLYELVARRVNIDLKDDKWDYYPERRLIVSILVYLTVEHRSTHVSV